MAINKNFVIKNGIEVNDNVFVVDPDINKVGINTALPEYELHVIGGIGVTDARVTGVTTALGDVLVANSNGVDGKAFAVRVSAGNSVGINTANPRYPLEIIGPASSGQVAEYVFGDLEITGDITSANINSGSANFTGVTTFTDTTQNTLGNADTGAVQIDGGLGVNQNVTVGGQLRVTGDSFFVGVVTFAAGASGTIQLGDNANDNVEFQADVNSNIIPNTTSTFNLGSDSQEWRDLHLAGNAGIGSLSVTGVSTFVGDVSIADKIVHTGDTNTTIRFPANDTVTVETAGSERLRIASDGSVGIGGLVPSSGNLVVNSTIRSQNASDNISYIGFTQYTGNTTVGNMFSYMGGDSRSSGYLNFSTNNTERLRIVSDGSVGIGTTNPEKTLTVHGDSSSSIRISKSGVLAYDHTFDGSSYTIANNNLSAGIPIILGTKTSGAESVRITSGGSVGIGTTNPQTQLHIKGTDSILRLETTATTGANYLDFYDASARKGYLGYGSVHSDTFFFVNEESAAPFAFYTKDSGASLTEKVRITSGGSVGIGSTIPAGKLDVDGHTELDDLNVAGVSTFAGAIDANGNLDVDGHTELDDLQISGITTFVNVTNNTLGDANTGSVQLDGGLGIAGNVTVGGGLSVTGNSYFVGMVTFAAGTDGNITLGDTNTDNVVFVADVDSNIVPNTDNAYDLGSSSQQWKDLYVNGLAELDFVNVSAASTFAGDVSIADKIVHTGDTNTALRFPAADTFTVETAGSERVRVDSAGNGNFGAEKAVAFPSGTGIQVYNSSSPRIKLVNDTTGNAAGDGSYLYVSGSDFLIENKESANMRFYTSATEKLRITSAGSVGIGTNNPTTKLHVAGDSFFVGDVGIGGTISNSPIVDIDAIGDILLNYNANQQQGIALLASTSGYGGKSTVQVYGAGSSSEEAFEVYNGAAGAHVAKITHDGSATFANVNVGGGLSVTGNSYFVGMVTFAAGTNGNITLGDNAGDNVVFNADVNSNFIPNTDNAYDLGSSSQQWRNLYVNGLSDLDFVNVSAASTFAGTIDANGRIVGAATSNVIPFLYSNFSDLPSGSTYHGAFAHVHATGKAYYAHANAWYELVNKNLAGIVGTGTEGYNVGVVTATNIDLNGDIDVDGHTELDNLNVSGISTFAQTNITNIDVTGITTTQILYVGAGGSTLTVDANNATFAIGSAATTVTATMNGGAIPSIGLVIALGG